jgi:hypothetical protein
MDHHDARVSAYSGNCNRLPRRALNEIAHRPLILIADDELLIRESLADALTESGYETIDKLLVSRAPDA